MKDIETGLVTVEHLRQALSQHGLVVVQNAFDSVAFNAARQKLVEAFQQDVIPQLEHSVDATTENILHIVQDPKNWPAGIVGNKGFGFLYAQPELKQDASRIQVSDGLSPAIAPCSAYMANVELVSHPHSQLAMDTLFSVTGNTGGMISQNSTKMHRGDLTKMHVDRYGSGDLHRVQAMAIGPGEGSVKLCFGRFTHRHRFQKILAKMLPKFADKQGFAAIPKDIAPNVLQLLTKLGVVHAAQPKSMIIWRSGILHFEALETRAGLQLRNKFTKTTCERYVIGTHRPQGLTQRQLAEFGFAADMGFVFHPYNNLNKGTVTGNNSFHLKTTQYKRCRKRTTSEIERVEKLQQDISKRDPVDRWIRTTSRRKLYCLGIEIQPSTTSSTIGIETIC